MADLPYEREVELVLFISSPHSRYEGRPSDGPLPAEGNETPTTIELRAGLGIVGDRYYAKPAHEHASVTIMAMESLDLVADDLGLPHSLNAEATRRNILIRGVNVDELRGATISLDTGDGAVELLVNRPANPCAWMNVMLAPGAHKALRGRGGMRCEPLTSGTLALGPALLRSSVPLTAAPVAAGAVAESPAL